MSPLPDGPQPFKSAQTTEFDLGLIRAMEPRAASVRSPRPTRPPRPPGRDSQPNSRDGAHSDRGSGVDPQDSSPGLLAPPVRCRCAAVTHGIELPGFLCSPPQGPYARRGWQSPMTVLCRHRASSSRPPSPLRGRPDGERCGPAPCSSRSGRRPSRRPQTKENIHDAGLLSSLRYDYGALEHLC